MNILSGDGDGGEIKGVRGMEGNRRKERESDEGSERGNNLPTFVKAVHSCERKYSRCWCGAIGCAVKVKLE